ncbi:MAG: DUF3131 domain-containing protein [Hafnia sp.]|mgnify:FL=1|jgi:hypothetical protein|nr:DUF3131 domain-containing protein [Hafnia paralvei]MCE9908842.1 DUF3131 domain-containing protein [Hafnia paralvei]MCE9912435.1 DUF3131 domain-containing protein [Hafnia paralvei]MCK2179954.1 DUF3131 domain-containing protein [Hafnia paralvei]NUN40843.1 DUF3131 domain-containing protein [Hafnia paralvei]TBM03759.1 DUF3131 domain-containing protein [Hafnia paralvei]
MLKTITLILSVAFAITVTVLMSLLARSEAPMLFTGKALSSEQLLWAKTAWRYVQNNTQPDSGLVNGKDRYPVTSLWNIGDTLIALTAARNLNIISQIEFDSRLSALLTTLANLPLTPAGTPASFYNTVDGSLNTQHPAATQAQDLARLLVGMRMVIGYFPEYRTFVERSIMRWDFCSVVNQEGLPLDGQQQNNQWDTQVIDDTEYSDYSRAAFALWGFSPSQQALPFKTAILFGLPIDYTTRDPRLSETPAGVESTPYILTGIELGWTMPEGATSTNTRMENRAKLVYQVQEIRWQKDKILTARSQYSRSTAPWEVYDSIFSNGYPWNTLADNNRYMPELALLSTRAIFGLWALWDTPFTNALMQLGSLHRDIEHGWFEGRYEISGGYNHTYTLTTNTLVLEALLFKSTGAPLIKPVRHGGYLDTRMKDIFNWPRHCLPAERHPPAIKQGGLNGD